MRLQQPIYVDKPVASLKLKLMATDVPDSASVTITDVQLQAGELATGVVPNQIEVATNEGQAQYRNGVVNNRMSVFALSNADSASPARLTVRNARGETRIGSYRFGEIYGTATANARNHTATHGWGRPPIITARQDCNLEAFATGRLHLRLAWNDREPQ